MSLQAIVLVNRKKAIGEENLLGNICHCLCGIHGYSKLLDTPLSELHYIYFWYA